MLCLFNQVAIETLAIVGYRSGNLSLAQASRLLRSDNHRQTEKLLGERGVTWNYTQEYLEADHKTLAK
ncbi:MAG: hypothetical protein C4527_21860 [Candidatus Omnitrophota bacterium]|nr:MAG: hypothetical protein C4527_21860 [Candidatus Omnitrophota bacterium]